MVSVNPVSFTAPNATGAPQQPMPRSRSDLLAYMLEKGSPATPDYSSVSSPVEGFAKALTSGLQGYMAKKSLQGEEEQKQARANAIADMLFGPTADGAPDPRRDQLASLLSSGAVGPDAFGGAIASKLGLGDPPEPIKLGQGDTLVDPRNYQPLYTAPQGPTKPYSNAGEVMEDVRRGFLSQEQGDAAMAKLGQGINIDMGGGTDKQVFDAMNESAVSARAAANGLYSLRQARSAVEAGGIFGQFADERLALQKLGALVGIADPEAIQNTETFRSAIAPQVAALMKATVGSTQISNADREFAEKAAGGRISLDEGSIHRLLDIMERASVVVVGQHNDRLNQVYPDTPEFVRERALFGVPGNAAAPPGGAPPPEAPGASAGDEFETEALRRGWIRQPDGTWQVP